MVKCFNCYDCPELDGCDYNAQGYIFENGSLIAEPYDVDENGYIMDEYYYVCMDNYGLPYCPRDL